MNSRWLFLLETFEEIQQDLRAYMDKPEEKELRYHIYRAVRCLAKAESLLDGSLADGNLTEVRQGWKVVRKLRTEFGKWHEALSRYYEDKGEHEKAKRETETALVSMPSNPDYYLQYAHITLKACGLSPNQEIEEILRRLTKARAYDAQVALKSAKLSLQSYAGMRQTNETIARQIAWIEQLDAGIAGKFPELHRQTGEARSAAQVKAELESLIGLDTVKQKINDAVNWLIFNRMRREQGFLDEPISMHMIFSGNPGTGKTTVARILAELYRSVGFLESGHLVEVDRSQLVAEYVGQTAIKTMGKIEEALGGVLFVDEAYALTRSQGGNDFGVEAVDTIVKAMEDLRGKFIVILAGYPDEMQQFLGSNPGLHSRFKNQIRFPDYSLGEMLQIGDALLGKKQFRMNAAAKTVFERVLSGQMRRHPDTHGNGRLVRNILEEAILNKASSVVDRRQANAVGNLDLLDEEILLEVERELNPFDYGRRL